jgi:hypothetical protein
VPLLIFVVQVHTTISMRMFLEMFPDVGIDRLRNMALEATILDDAMDEGVHGFTVQDVVSVDGRVMAMTTHDGYKYEEPVR